MGAVTLTNEGGSRCVGICGLQSEVQAKIKLEIKGESSD